jgi:hypothetical protein
MGRLFVLDGKKAWIFNFICPFLPFPPFYLWNAFTLFLLMRERYGMVGLMAERNMQETPPIDIPRLVEAAKEDPVAFGRLYNLYVQPIYRYLYSQVGTVHDAEDLTSQTFMTAYESLTRYRERGFFSAWLFRIARSRLIDHFRGRSREVGLAAAEK